MDFFPCKAFVYFALSGECQMSSESGFVATSKSNQIVQVSSFSNHLPIQSFSKNMLSKVFVTQVVQPIVPINQIFNDFENYNSVENVPILKKIDSNSLMSADNDDSEKEFLSFATNNFYYEKICLVGEFFYFFIFLLF